MNKTLEKLESLQNKIEALKKKYNIPEKSQKLAQLKTESQKENVWDNPKTAASIFEEISQIEKQLKSFEEITGQLKSLVELANEAGEDDQMLLEIEAEIDGLSQIVEELEEQAFLSGKYDNHGAILSIHAGQGGTEAMDWSSILHRMYMKYAENKKWKASVIDMIPGEEAGIKSVSIKIEGYQVYGLLKKEAGIHRLVRISPFNAQNLRQTSFAKVEVLPLIEDEKATDIDPKTIEFEAYRAGGHGGQNVNKVETAVRIKHIPTGIVVQSQSERFQVQNRKIALQMLAAKLWELEEEARLKEEMKLKGENPLASWGRQIRSYVLHPYKLVKDLRTNIESNNTDAVLAGDLEKFIQAELRL